MASRYLSTHAQPWAEAASNLASVFFPNGRTEAAGRMAGQQLSELAARTDKARAEAAYQQDQNAALTDAALEAAGFDPKMRAFIRVGRGTANQLASAYQTMGQIAADAAAGDAYARRDFVGTVAAQLRGGRNPLEVNRVQDGYQLNPFDAGGQITATGKTMTDIAATQALRRQRDAAAGYDMARTVDPQRFQSQGSSSIPKVTPTDAANIDNLIGNYIASIGSGNGAIPGVIDPALRNEVLTRASELYRQTGDAQASVAQAFNELVELEQAGTAPTPAVDEPFYNIFANDKPAQPGTPNRYRRKMGPPPKLNFIDPSNPASMQISPPTRIPAGAEAIRERYKRGEISKEQARAEIMRLGGQ